MTQNNKKLISLAVQLVIAAGIALAVALRQGFALDGHLFLNCRFLSDGFFVSTVIFLGLGMLLWISATGFFDIFSYGFKSLLVLFSPLKKASEHPHYYEYKCEKDAKREGKPVTHTVLWAGLVCLALSLICLMLYYQLMPADFAL